MRFGVAVSDITPPFPTLMHGYGARKDFYDVVNDPLTFTALVLEEGRRRALIAAADLCTFPTGAALDPLLARLARVVGCSRQSILLNASHTHGGPLIPSDRTWTRTLEDGGSGRQYVKFLERKAVEAARAAVRNLQEGSLWHGEGTTALPLNRRKTVRGEVLNAPNPAGPTDPRLPVLVVRDRRDAVAVVAARFACHPVTTGAQHRITSDYPGAWRAAVRAAFDERVIPMFLQGAGADTRPRHAREGDKWAQRPHSILPAMGRELCADTLRVLTGTTLKPLGRLSLRGVVRKVSAPCERRCTRAEDFEPLLHSDDKYERVFAQRAMDLIRQGRRVPDHAEFRVQTLRLTRDLALIGLDVEPLLALGRAVERGAAPARAILLGYVNGCVGYAPDSREMKRGGYETSSYIHAGWTGPLLPGLERLFADAVTA